MYDRALHLPLPDAGIGLVSTIAVEPPLGTNIGHPHRRRRGIAKLGAARRLVHNVHLAVAAYRRIAYHYDVGNELYRLMLYETRSEAVLGTRWLRDAQLVFA